MPKDILTHLTGAQFSAIIAHELCHWRRRDNLTAAIHMIVESLFWFHPLVWWLGSRMVVERERACDEAVIRSGSDRQLYAEGILKICQLYVEPRLLCVAGVSGGTLRKRIEEIMTHKVLFRLPFAKKCVLAIAGFVAIAGPFAVGLTNDPHAFAQTQQQTANSVSLPPSTQTNDVETKRDTSSEGGLGVNMPEHRNAFPAGSTNAPAKVIYVVTREPANSRTLTVTVERAPSFTDTSLILRAAKWGLTIKPQVENLSCDGAALVPGKDPGTWFVPAACKSLRWQVPLELPGAGNASTQRSIGSADGKFCLFSEASSLPRLADASPPEILTLPPKKSGEVTSRSSRILPVGMSQPPLFALIGSMPVAERMEGKIRLAYFVDDTAQIERLPDISMEMLGLQWLGKLAPDARNTVFNDVWLGMSDTASSMGGAAGTEILLVNYIRGNVDSERKTVTAMAPLIEATHQYASSYGVRPGWTEESLAVYFGLEALHHALPNDDAPNDLRKKFIKDADRFPPGLIEVERRVAGGDSSLYGAYFTKGVAFWAAVDEAMRHAGVEGGLGRKLEEVWTTKFDPKGRPPANFANLLGLSDSVWRQLSDRFLEPT